MSQFNIALLAKQRWCLINYPNSLVARVLKAKYYPNTDFNNAQLGNIPSLTWKSVWAAKGLLNNGLCWRVGKGDGISIWEDCWIPGKEPEEWNRRNRSEEYKLVSELIDSNTRTWKSDIINSNFPIKIAQQIIQIPLAKIPHNDLQV